MRPEISVVIPSYNSAAYLPDAIDSALNQTTDPLEVIVVNDGSTDETARILERYQGRVVSISQENRGLSAARNRGIAAARGDLIAFLDADDIWLPEKLEKQLACLGQYPQAALVHSQLYYWDAQTGEKSIERHRGRHEFSGRCYDRLFFRSGVIPSTMIVRSDCLAHVGGFDEEIRRPTSQDYDLCLRIARHYEFGFVDEPLILYRRHASNFTNQAMACLEDELFVVRKVARADPGLRRAVGRSAVDERLFSLLFDISYRHHDADRAAEARRYLLQALHHRPFHARVWSLYLANFLPYRWVRKLRQLKACLSFAAQKEAVASGCGNEQ
jgi:glycosyltransferase involved in cell wall biosynthesis